MADNPRTNGQGGEGRTDGQMRILWDDSDACDVHATVAQVKASREAFMLLFGSARGEPEDSGQVRAALDRRIVLPPVAAKRLALQLAGLIRNYEAAVGSIVGHARPYERLKPTPLLRPPEFRSAEGAKKADLLFRFLEEHKVKPAFERSCEFMAGRLLANRFLLGFEKSMIRRNPHEKILGLCAEMDMPDNFLAAFLQNLPEANIVGFGFGEHEGACMVKAYLEFGYRFYRALKSGPLKPEPYLSHLGFKWDAKDSSRKALARYTCFPGFTAGDVQVKLAADHYGDKAALFEIIKGVLDLAAERVDRERFLYLDVKEENNPRSSFDVNLYAANLRLQEIHPWLQKLCRHYSISEKPFLNFYDAAKTHILGHLAGGVDREGRDFLTLYYGE